MNGWRDASLTHQPPQLVNLANFKDKTQAALSLANDHLGYPILACMDGSALSFPMGAHMASGWEFWTAWIHSSLVMTQHSVQGSDECSAMRSLSPLPLSSNNPHCS